MRDLDRYLRVREKHPAAHLEWLWLGGRSRKDRLTGSGRLLFVNYIPSPGSRATA